MNHSGREVRDVVVRVHPNNPRVDVQPRDLKPLPMNELGMVVGTRCPFAKGCLHTDERHVPHLEKDEMRASAPLLSQWNTTARPWRSCGNVLSAMEIATNSNPMICLSARGLKAPRITFGIGA